MDTLTANASEPLTLPLGLHILGQGWQNDFTTKLIVTLTLLTIVSVSYYVGNADRPYRGFKLIGIEKGEWSYTPAKQRWATNSVKLVEQGLKETGEGPFQVMTSTGPCIVLPIRYLDDVKNNESCSMSEWAKRDLLGAYPGLEVFGSNDPVFNTVVRQKLTQSLASLTAPLTEEMGLFLKEELGDAKDWQDFELNKLTEDIAARLSALVFLGRPQCRDKAWLDISTSYTVNCVKTVRRASQVHSLLRPLVFRFLPEARLLQAQRRRAKAIIGPVVAERRAARLEAQQAGREYEGRDAVAWFEDVACSAGAPGYNHVSAQLSLSTAAIHTTSTTMAFIMCEILQRPELVAPLRAEVVRVLREDGGEWKKTSLYKMRLLDSVMKETIRVTTSSPFAIRRRAVEAITLSDGTVIPKGAYFMVSCVHLLDPAVFGGPDGDKFDGYRFLKMREQPGHESRWQFVATGPDSMRFSHGSHACPGRFFAANEIKIAFAHMLLKYDWRFKTGPPKSRGGEYSFAPDPTLLVQFKSRQPEVEL